MGVKTIRWLNFVVFNQPNFWEKYNHEKTWPHIPPISEKNVFEKKDHILTKLKIPMKFLICDICKNVKLLPYFKL